MRWSREQVVEVYRRYGVYGSYARVGRELGLSRERVRQILSRGRSMAWIGLDNFRSQRERTKRRLIERLDRDTVMRFLLEYGSRTKAARRMGIGKKRVEWLCSYYGIDWRSYRREYLIQRLVDRFRGVVFSESDFPSTYRLQRLQGGKALYHRILTYFKGYQEFIEYYKGTFQRDGGGGAKGRENRGGLYGFLGGEDA